ncbi:MAG TPA: aminotransferase class I/II-fold pyridoxal phosphate-dependent enzyme, partial [Dehalococcoidales bacterium]|nr:aminotransferase class I/II-fold pyridoxal phosphate-dependent enzyme [Dehalococcoidales bacterium]
AFRCILPLRRVRWFRSFFNLRCSAKTKVLILNSPSNPLSVIMPPDLVQDLVAMARRRDLYIVSDEVYDKIIYDGCHTSALSFDTDGRVVAVFSFSKSYAMTGWRVGYAVAPDPIADQITKLQEAYVSSAPSVSQKAAEAALLSSQDCVETMRLAYAENLVAASEILDGMGISYQQPRGAFYVWIDVNSQDSTAFAKDFLTREKVAVAPGATFGPSGNRYIRISLAASRESIQEGLRRLGSFRHE